MVLQNLPGKLFTMDNYRSLQTDNICPAGGIGKTSLLDYAYQLAKSADAVIFRAGAFELRGVDRPLQVFAPPVQREGELPHCD